MDKHFGMFRYTPNPFSGYPFHYLDGLYPNRHGGAFAPYFIDTASGYYKWINPIPAAINFDSLLYHYPALASGKVIRDQNRNCAYEPGTDLPMANRLVQITNPAPNSFPYFTSTDANGNWVKPLPYGSYTIKHAITPNRLAECPGPNGFSGVNLIASSPTAAFSFYDTLKTNYRDMKVLLASTRFVPGFTRQLSVFAINNSSIVTSDTLRIMKPSILNYVSASPSPHSISGNTITWVLNNMAPDSVASITVNLATPPTTSIGTSLTFSALFANTADSFLTDNKDTLRTLVVGPYDPNCKTVNQPTYTTAQKDWIYTIEFQNTGNYPAQDVVITDKLDTLLDPATIRLLKASHSLPAMEWQEGNVLLFRFNNIYLQDSVHNEPASHGFVTFSIRPVSNIRVGDQIENAAAIYFDFNAPILTNSTLNIISAPTAVPAEAAKQQHFAVYPNPANTSVTIQSEMAGNGVLFDIQGRSLLHFKILAGRTNMRLPTGITPGIYILHAQSSMGADMGVQRLTVK